MFDRQGYHEQCKDCKMMFYNKRDLREHTRRSHSKKELDRGEPLKIHLPPEAQWITFEFGGLFVWLCLVTCVSCCFFLAAVPFQRRACLVRSGPRPTGYRLD